MGFARAMYPDRHRRLILAFQCFMRNFWPVRCWPISRLVLARSRKIVRQLRLQPLNHRASRRNQGCRSFGGCALPIGYDPQRRGFHDGPLFQIRVALHQTRMVRLLDQSERAGDRSWWCRPFFHPVCFALLVEANELDRRTNNDMGDRRFWSSARYCFRDPCFFGGIFWPISSRTRETLLGTACTGRCVTRGTKNRYRRPQ